MIALDMLRAEFEALKDLHKAPRYQRKPPKDPTGWEPPTATRKTWKKPDHSGRVVELPRPTEQFFRYQIGDAVEGTYHGVAFEGHVLAGRADTMTNGTGMFHIRLNKPIHVYGSNRDSITIDVVSKNGKVKPFGDDVMHPPREQLEERRVRNHKAHIDVHTKLLSGIINNYPPGGKQAARMRRARMGAHEAAIRAHRAALNDRTKAQAAEDASTRAFTLSAPPAT